MKIRLILLLIGLQSYAQNSNDQQILAGILETQPNLKIVYVKQSDGYKAIDLLISKKVIPNIDMPADSIILSPKEIKWISKEIIKNRNFEFPMDMLAGAQIVSNDTVIKYSANKSKAWRIDYDKIFSSGDSTKLARFKEQRGYSYSETWVHVLSKPIYFRNGTLCIIYHAKLCNLHSGVGGYSEILVYKKINSSWVRYLHKDLYSY